MMSSFCFRWSTKLVSKVTFIFFAVESWDLHTNTNWSKDKNQINWTYIKPWEDYQTPWLRMVLYALNSSVNVNVRHLYARKRFAPSGPSIPWRENKDLDSSSFVLPQVTLHLLIDHKQPVDPHKERGSHYFIYVHVGACWSSGMILASGARGPGFDSRTGPFWQTCEVKDKTYLLF